MNLNKTYLNGLFKEVKIIESVKKCNLYCTGSEVQVPICLESDLYLCLVDYLFGSFEQLTDRVRSNKRSRRYAP